jgi:hypothetical protein
MLLIVMVRVEFISWVDSWRLAMCSTRAISFSIECTFIWALGSTSEKLTTEQSDGKCAADATVPREERLWIWSDMVRKVLVVVFQRVR